MRKIPIYFSDFFDLSRHVLRAYGAFDISLINDLPMFIDPFLLFNSPKPEYRSLHAEMIRYVRFLKHKSADSALDTGSMHAWYIFKEVKQNWLGFCLSGNSGNGLGPDFARALHENFSTTFRDFGEEKLPKARTLKSSHFSIQASAGITLAISRLTSSRNISWNIRKSSHVSTSIQP